VCLDLRLLRIHRPPVQLRHWDVPNHALGPRPTWCDKINIDLITYCNNMPKNTFTRYIHVLPIYMGILYVFVSIAANITCGNSGHGIFLNQSRSLQNTDYIFQHSCNIALLVAAPSYNIPDGEVRCFLPVRCPAANFSSSGRFAAIFTQTSNRFPSYLQNLEVRRKTVPERLSLFEITKDARVQVGKVTSSLRLRF